MAERGGFEPPRTFAPHDFQSCSLSRSDISPLDSAIFLLMCYLSIGFSSLFSAFSIVPYAVPVPR